MFGIIGKKLGHSFSADFFNKKFQKEGLDESYHKFEIDDINLLPSLIKNHPDLKGLNVTIPYKQQVIPFLDSLSDEARNIGAINVIKIFRDGEKILLKGYNSDAIGFRESLVPLLNSDVKKALVLGSGGASKAVTYILKSLGIEPSIVSRTPNKEVSDIKQYSYDELTKELIEDHQLIVNTTPLGMFPEVEFYPPIPYSFITDKHICYDVIYNPMETEFMKKCSRQGAVVKNGMDMLHLQAIAAWDIWTE